MDTPNTYFDLFLGYSAVWLLLAVFLVQLWRKQRALSRQITQVENRIAAAAAVARTPSEMIRANS